MPDDREIREKLVLRGTAVLSDEELLSILLHEGIGTAPAIELAHNVIAEHGGLAALARADLKTLRMNGGIGIKRGAIMAAAFELGRRVAREDAVKPIIIATNEDVVSIFRPMLSALQYEEFWVLYLSAANTVIDKQKVSQGGVSATVVDHKLIVKRAVELLSSAIILVHNHPSGVASPSPEDKSLTEKVMAAASLFDIAVLDHLIITSGDSFSFRQTGLIG